MCPQFARLSSCLVVCRYTKVEKTGRTILVASVRQSMTQRLAAVASRASVSLSNKRRLDLGSYILSLVYLNSAKEESEDSMSTNGAGSQSGSGGRSGSAGGARGKDTKGKGRAGGRGGRGGVRRAADYTPAQEPRVDQAAIAEASRVAIERAQREAEKDAAASGNTGTNGEQEEPDLCYICAEPVKYYALGTCSHRTCHVCSLRLRALYKKRECTFCKVSWDPDFPVLIDRYVHTAIRLTLLSGNCRPTYHQ